MNGKQKNLYLHESKQNPSSIPDTKIVEAYGLKKCPKLVEQVASDDIDVRQNALSVVCEEFKNPFVIQGCCESGIVKVLSSMISDPDYITRLRASKALSMAAEDACGLESILLDETIAEILLGMNDGALEVRRNVYECLCHTTRTTAGVHACVAADVTTQFVNFLVEEDDSLKPVMLRTIHNLSKVSLGLEDALKANAVRICIQLLRDTHDEAVRLNAAKTLGFLCYSEEAKQFAINERGVDVLINLLLDGQNDDVTNAVTLSLMSIGSTDEGKKQVFECNGVGIIIKTLETTKNRIVKINLLKIISNIAVYPSARNLLRTDNIILLQNETKMSMSPNYPCVVTMQKIRTQAESSNDSLMLKHVGIALSAVLWMP
jgi:hypothetical protein